MPAAGETNKKNCGISLAGGDQRLCPRAYSSKARIS
jgi:hypothetical protein